MSANKQSGVSLTTPDTDVRTDRSGRRHDGLALVTYWAEAGIASTAAGAWASTALSGRLRILVWVGVTTVLAVAAIWFAEPVIGLLSRGYRAGRSRRPPNGS